jgi:conjugative transfer signal peptidase TraF
MIGKWVIAVPVALAGLTISALAFGIKINTTTSMPRGLYMETTAPAGTALHRGDVVVACVEWQPKAQIEPYISAGVCQDTKLEPVLKPVAAIPGDVIDFIPQGIVVNGILLPHSARLNSDSTGAILPNPLRADEQSVVVPHGYVWLIAPNDKSLDSRYLGPFRTSAIISVATPLIVE